MLRSTEGSARTLPPSPPPVEVCRRLRATRLLLLRLLLLLLLLLLLPLLLLLLLKGQEVRAQVPHTRISNPPPPSLGRMAHHPWAPTVVVGHRCARRRPRG